MKLITIGEAGVGKTALTLRYVNNTYGYNEMTIGVDFAIKHLPDGEKIQIWDTAGQESFRSISRSYFRGADAALICFDLTNLNSFTKIKYWYDDLRTVNTNAICVIVATKADKQAVVPRERINSLIEDLDLMYFETSAKNGNVSEPFEYVYKNVAAKSETPTVNVVQKQNNNNCCYI